MHPDFWHERWQTGCTGFHRDAVNPWLVHHWPLPGITRGGRVLVPLCGKSLDMLWLLEQGYRVTGAPAGASLPALDGKFECRGAQGEGEIA